MAITFFEQIKELTKTSKGNVNSHLICDIKNKITEAASQGLTCANLTYLKNTHVSYEVRSYFMSQGFSFQTSNDPLRSFTIHW